MLKLQPASLRFRQIEDKDHDLLVQWITSDTWPHHLFENPTEDDVRKWIAEGKYNEPDYRAFFAFLADESQSNAVVNTPVAYTRLEELTDLTPVFDLRIRSDFRGKGLGRAVLNWLTRYVFTQTDKLRFEGHTRADNIGMQKVFRSCNWVQEAYYRQAWPDKSGGTHDAVAFAILKSDWENGTRTPIKWDPSNE